GVHRSEEDRLERAAVQRRSGSGSDVLENPWIELEMEGDARNFTRTGQDDLHRERLASRDGMSIGGQGQAQIVLRSRRSRRARGRLVVIRVHHLRLRCRARRMTWRDISRYPSHRRHLVHCGPGVLAGGRGHHVAGGWRGGHSGGRWPPVVVVVPDGGRDERPRHERGRRHDGPVDRSVHQGTWTTPPCPGPKEAATTVPFSSIIWLLIE